MKQWNVYLKGKFLETVEMGSHLSARSVVKRLVEKRAFDPACWVVPTAKDHPQVETGHSPLAVLMTEVTSTQAELVTGPMEPGQVGGCMTAGHLVLQPGVLMITQHGLDALLEMSFQRGYKKAKAGEGNQQ